MTNAAALPETGPDAGATTGPDAAAARVEYLTFLTGERRFAAPITDVREIRNWSTPTTLPHAPPYLLGVVNLRGTVLPVIDLAMRLGIGATEAAPRNVFVVVEVEDRPIGLLVEAVADIVKPALDDYQPLPETGATEAGGLVEGLILSDEGMIQILALPALTVLRAAIPETLAVPEDRAC